MTTKKRIDYKGEADLSRFIFIFIAVGVLIFIVIIFAILNKQDGKSGFETQRTPQTDEVRNTLPGILYNLSGPVEDTGENFIVVNADVFKMSEGGQISKVSEKRIVFITPETKITKLTLVSQEGTAKKLPQESPTTFSEISADDTVEVISNQNIADKQQFRATHVRVLP